MLLTVVVAPPRQGAQARQQFVVLHTSASPMLIRKVLAAGLKIRARPPPAGTVWLFCDSAVATVRRDRDIPFIAFFA
ncbi:hypothetical protein GCM10011492_28540 [Flexivirga endophytica]|uniref:Uncharacterized protein n=1 Tax=Flexivirga endophytica TaxID=1849103 RepID=A0A916T8U9_9MICO|nr:hypothetical protein [Flexivirga endophytica]GGB36112.1 hypothetical protein GCM10011492_28540 [Flexivirga endophytica]GHB43871.1 hypothetical protein GCM10008112_10920 [Flexivirga endophytica]